MIARTAQIYNRMTERDLDMGPELATIYHMSERQETNSLVIRRVLPTLATGNRDLPHSGYPRRNNLRQPLPYSARDQRLSTIRY
ncbi:MAG TPA: hypothetical protein VKB96_02240 [Gammaproteobacteria bacterium]|nr:hypothetical protein [Gammaproteobacteria bacterium]